MFITKVQHVTERIREVQDKLCWYISYLLNTIIHCIKSIFLNLYNQTYLKIIKDSSGSTPTLPC